MVRSAPPNPAVVQLGFRVAREGQDVSGARHGCKHGGEDGQQQAKILRPGLGVIMDDAALAALSGNLHETELATAGPQR